MTKDKSEIRSKKKQPWAWYFYDWANSSYAVVVLAGFFPVFFKQYWDTASSAELSTFHLGLTNSAASLLVVLLAPMIGAVADQMGRKTRLLGAFAALGLVMTGALYWVGQGHWQIASVLFVVSFLGFAGGNIIYDSLLAEIAAEGDMERISATGYAFGYLGSGLLFAFDVYMTLHPSAFGLAGSAQAVRLSFLSVALWWGVFSGPVLLMPSAPGAGPRAEKKSLSQSIRGAFRQLYQTFTEIRCLREVSLFLFAYWLYIDGVHTIIRMAVDYGLALGLGSDSLIKALLITQFVGFPAAWLYGLFGQKVGAKNGIITGIGAYILITVAATQMQTAAGFFTMAVAIGLVQGGVQALSRAFYARIIPAGKSAEFFGFYNMLGKFAAVIGPMVVGWSSVLWGSRYGILSIAVLLVAGGLLLVTVNETRAKELARRL